MPCRLGPNVVNVKGLGPCRADVIPFSLFIDDIATRQQSRKTGHHHDIVVTDNHALAAHTHWHKVTKGVWLNYVKDWDDEYGTSGTLLQTRPQDCAKTVWKTAATSSCTLTIHFKHRFLQLLVDFEVTELACKQFDVRVLNERIHSQLTDSGLRQLTVEEGLLLRDLNDPILGTNDAIGRIPFMDLLVGMGGKTGRQSGYRIYAN